MEIDRIRAEPISDDELSLATSYLSGVFPIRFETTAAIATAIANLVVYGLDDSYFDGYRTKIQSVSPTAVLEAARRHLDPGRLRLTVVGDPAKIREPLEALGVGPVIIYDTDGVAIG